MSHKILYLLVLFIIFLTGCDPIASVEDKNHIVSCDIYKIRQINDESETISYKVFGKLTVRNNTNEDFELDFKK